MSELDPDAIEAADAREALELAERADPLAGATYADLEPGSAAAKIMRTIVEISSAGGEAGELELGMASLAMALEPVLAQGLRGKTDAEIDGFVLALCRFVATMRSDRSRELAVVELPRAPNANMKPSAHLCMVELDKALVAGRAAAPPF